MWSYNPALTRFCSSSSSRRPFGGKALLALSLWAVPCLCPSLQVKSVINLLFAAYTGDVTALRRWLQPRSHQPAPSRSHLPSCHCASAGWRCRRWTWSKGTTTPERPSTSQPRKVKPTVAEAFQRFAANADLLNDVPAASRTRGGRAIPPGGLQSEPSTQRQVSPALPGRLGDLRTYPSAALRLTDGAARRWTRPCTSATMTWWTSCGGVRRRTPRLLLATPRRAERRARARSSNGTGQSTVHPYANTTIRTHSAFYICVIIGPSLCNCVLLVRCTSIIYMVKSPTFVNVYEISNMIFSGVIIVFTSNISQYRCKCVIMSSEKFPFGIVLDICLWD